MTAFLIWITIISLAISVYILTLWLRAKNRSRFQARLSILFLLFVFIPTVPLTLFVSMLLTKSTELFLLPKVEESLSKSLVTIRMQLEEQGQNKINDWTQTSPTELPGTHLYILSGKVQNELLVIEQSLSNLPPNVQPAILNQDGNMNWLLEDQSGGRILPYESHHIYEAYRTFADSSVIILAFQVSPLISSSIQDIDTSLRYYSSISFLGDTAVEQGLAWSVSIFFIIILTLAAIYTSRGIARGISDPIKDLTSGMEKVGDGDLDVVVDTKARDEIQFLISSFNEMVHELKTSRDNLQRAERIAAWRDVARQISHEIKNPLTPMQFSLYRIKDTLPDELLENNDITESFRIIEEEISSMRRLASEFSEFARMPLMQLKPENVGDIIQDSTRLFEAKESSVFITLNMDSNLPRKEIDREQFRRAIHNLLKNAVEASQPGDSITVNVTKSDNNQVNIDIIDTGCGMDEETLAKSPDPYFTTKKEGTGLGMFIVNRIISDHNGRLSIKSEKNVGTTISIIL